MLFKVTCPRCKKHGTIESDLDDPHVNCGDCLIECVEVVEMDLFQPIINDLFQPLPGVRVAGRPDKSRKGGASWH